MKKVVKVAGYQGKASVHTRSMDFFINKLSKTFNFEYEKDITLSGKKASSLIELTRNNNILISYVFFVKRSKSLLCTPQKTPGHNKEPKLLSGVSQ